MQKTYTPDYLTGQKEKTRAVGDVPGGEHVIGYMG